MGNDQSYHDGRPSPNSFRYPNLEGSDPESERSAERPIRGATTLGPSTPIADRSYDSGESSSSTYGSDSDDDDDRAERRRSTDIAQIASVSSIDFQSHRLWSESNDQVSAVERLAGTLVGPYYRRGETIDQARRRRVGSSPLYPGPRGRHKHLETMLVATQFGHETSVHSTDILSVDDVRSLIDGDAVVPFSTVDRFYPYERHTDPLASREALFDHALYFCLASVANMLRRLYCLTQLQRDELRKRACQSSRCDPIVGRDRFDARPLSLGMMVEGLMLYYYAVHMVAVQTGGTDHRQRFNRKAIEHFVDSLGHPFALYQKHHSRSHALVRTILQGLWNEEAVSGRDVCELEGIDPWIVLHLIPPPPSSSSTPPTTTDLDRWLRNVVDQRLTVPQSSDKERFDASASYLDRYDDRESLDLMRRQEREYRQTYWSWCRQQALVDESSPSASASSSSSVPLPMPGLCATRSGWADDGDGPRSMIPIERLPTHRPYNERQAADDDDDDDAGECQSFLGLRLIDSLVRYLIVDWRRCCQKSIDRRKASASSASSTDSSPSSSSTAPDDIHRSAYARFENAAWRYVSVSCLRQTIQICIATRSKYEILHQILRQLGPNARWCLDSQSPRNIPRGPVCSTTLFSVDASPQIVSDAMIDFLKVVRHNHVVDRTIVELQSDKIQARLKREKVASERARTSDPAARKRASAELRRLDRRLADLGRQESSWPRRLLRHDDSSSSGDRRWIDLRRRALGRGHEDRIDIVNDPLALGYGGNVARFVSLQHGLSKRRPRYPRDEATGHVRYRDGLCLWMGSDRQTVRRTLCRHGVDLGLRSVIGTLCTRRWATMITPVLRMCAVKSSDGAHHRTEDVDYDPMVRRRIGPRLRHRRRRRRRDREPSGSDDDGDRQRDGDRPLVVTVLLDKRHPPTADQVATIKKVARDHRRRLERAASSSSSPPPPLLPPPPVSALHELEYLEVSFVLNQLALLLRSFRPRVTLTTVQPTRLSMRTGSMTAQTAMGSDVTTSHPRTAKSCRRLGPSMDQYMTRPEIDLGWMRIIHGGSVVRYTFDIGQDDLLRRDDDDDDDYLSSAGLPIVPLSTVQADIRAKNDPQSRIDHVNIDPPVWMLSYLQSRQSGGAVAFRDLSFESRLRIDDDDEDVLEVSTDPRHLTVPPAFYRQEAPVYQSRRDRSRIVYRPSYAKMMTHASSHISVRSQGRQTEKIPCYVGLAVKRVSYDDIYQMFYVDRVVAMLDVNIDQLSRALLYHGHVPEPVRQYAKQLFRVRT